MTGNEVRVVRAGEVGRTAIEVEVVHVGSVRITRIVVAVALPLPIAVAYMVAIRACACAWSRHTRPIQWGLYTE